MTKKGSLFTPAAKQAAHEAICYAADQWKATTIQLFDGSEDTAAAILTSEPAGRGLFEDMTPDERALALSGTTEELGGPVQYCFTAEGLQPWT